MKGRDLKLFYDILNLSLYLVFIWLFETLFFSSLYLFPTKPLHMLLTSVHCRLKATQGLVLQIYILLWGLLSVTHSSVFFCLKWLLFKTFSYVKDSWVLFIKFYSLQESPEEQTCIDLTLRGNCWQRKMRILWKYLNRFLMHGIWYAIDLWVI